MKEHFTKFEKGIKESFGDFEMPFEANQWENLEMKLDGKSASSLNTLAAAVVTVLVLLSGVSYVVITSQNNHSHSEHTSKLIQSNGEDVKLDPVDLTDNKKGNVATASNNDKILENEQRLEETARFISSDDSEKSRSNQPPNKIIPINEIENKAVEIISAADKASGSEGQVNSKAEESSLKPESMDDGAPAISVSASKVCAGEKIKFEAENITDESKFLWNFGNADFSTEINPVRSFDTPGEYNISLILSKSSRKIESKIIVLPHPESNFSWKEDEIGVIKLSNESEKAAQSEWKIDNEPFSNEINPSFNYTEEGKKLISLRVENEYGCADSTLKYVKLSAPVFVTAPKVFKQGEGFAPVMKDVNNGVMSLSIHNMRGQLIYESEDGKSWDGRMPDGTFAAPNTEFAWLIMVKNNEGQDIFSDSGKVKILP